MKLDIKSAFLVHINWLNNNSLLAKVSLELRANKCDTKVLPILVNSQDVLHNICDVTKGGN